MHAIWSNNDSRRIFYFLVVNLVKYFDRKISKGRKIQSLYLFFAGLLWSGIFVRCVDEQFGTDQRRIPHALRLLGAGWLKRFFCIPLQ